MKTSEMIAMLEKNPKLKFKADYQSYLLGKDGDCLMWFSVNGERCGEAVRIFGYDWQLVREPVTWQEALQAWAEGKTIKCKLSTADGETRHNTGVYQGDEFYLKDRNGLGISRDELKVGIWYILDGEFNE